MCGHVFNKNLYDETFFVKSPDTQKTAVVGTSGRDRKMAHAADEARGWMRIHVYVDGRPEPSRIRTTYPFTSPLDEKDEEEMHLQDFLEELYEGIPEAWLPHVDPPRSMHLTVGNWSTHANGDGTWRVVDNFLHTNVWLPQDGDVIRTLKLQETSAPTPRIFLIAHERHTRQLDTTRDEAKRRERLVKDFWRTLLATAIGEVVTDEVCENCLGVYAYLRDVGLDMAPDSEGHRKWHFLPVGVAAVSRAGSEIPEGDGASQAGSEIPEGDEMSSQYAAKEFWNAMATDGATSPRARAGYARLVDMRIGLPDVLRDSVPATHATLFVPPKRVQWASTLERSTVTFYCENGPTEDAADREWRAHYKGMERAKLRRLAEMEHAKLRRIEKMQSGGGFGRRGCR